MIINIGNNKALWFGYELRDAEIMTFEEGIRLLMKRAGHEWAEVKAQFDVVGGDTLASRIGRYDNPPVTNEDFMNHARNYIKSLNASSWKYPDSVSVITTSQGTKGEGIAYVLFRFYATK